MIDRLRELAIFAKTIDHGSFRGAAAELRLSPSVVSHHVSQLEEHLGVALLYRTTRKLRLTREGERLLVAARNMLDAVEGELTSLATGATEPSGELRITVPSVLSQSPFTDALAKFAIKYPRIKLAVDYSDQRRDLIEAGFDVGIRMTVTRRKSPNSRFLYSAGRTLVAAPSYLEQHPAISAPEDAEGLDWLELAPVQNLPVTFSHAEEGSVTIKPSKRRISTNDAQAMFRLARAGAGLAILPDFLAAADISTGRVVEVLPDWKSAEVYVYADWPKNAPKHGLIRLLVTELSDGSLT